MLGFARPFSGRIALSALGVGTLVLTAACSGGSDAAEGGDQLVVGFALSQSGNMAPFDVEPGNAALLRIKEINADGGIDGKIGRAHV